MILLVDDNEYLSQSFKELLKISYIDADVVCNGEEAIEACEKFDYSVVVTDLNMPKASGFDLVASLNYQNNSAKVIIYSGNVEKKERKILLSYKNVFAVHEKSDLIETLISSVKKAEQLNVISNEH